MKGFMNNLPLIFILGLVIIGARLDRGTVSGHYFNKTQGENKTTKSTQEVKTRVIRDTIYISTREDILNKMNTLPDDSIERIYDMNYMDRDPRYLNHMEDDEWSEYF